MTALRDGAQSGRNKGIPDGTVPRPRGTFQKHVRHFQPGIAGLEKIDWALAQGLTGAEFVALVVMDVRKPARIVGAYCRWPLRMGEFGPETVTVEKAN